ncbi:MAG TPA: ABC transporter substrate-binding protein [Candidatus Limnocylindrales bacterium]|nr:ABC transporter substrate-binding protein [Candidatus Limnocylindrales bacterium]
MTATTPLAAGFATIGQGAGPMMVTWKAGLFAKHGLDITRPRLMGSAKGVVRGLMTGEIQFGNLAAPAPLRADLKGEADVVFLTGGINQQFVIGRPGLNSRMELAGKKIGTVADGGIGDALVKFVIAKLSAAGIKGLREEPIPPGAAAELEALLNGTVDAVVGTPPECIDAIRHGCKYLIDFAEYGLNYALGGIAARRDYIENTPEITRKFVTAYVEGMHRYRTDREFTIDVQADYSGIADRTIAAETYDLTQPGMPRAPYPVVASLQTLLDFMANELPEAKGVDAQRFVDDRFIRELEDNGFINSLTR